MSVIIVRCQRRLTRAVADQEAVPIGLALYLSKKASIVSGRTQGARLPLLRLLVMQRLQRIDSRRTPRRNVVRDQRYRKKQTGSSGHYGRIERRYAVQQCA